MAVRSRQEPEYQQSSVSTVLSWSTAGRRLLRKSGSRCSFNLRMRAPAKVIPPAPSGLAIGDFALQSVSKRIPGVITPRTAKTSLLEPHSQRFDCISPWADHPISQPAALYKASPILYNICCTIFGSRPNGSVFIKEELEKAW